MSEKNVSGILLVDKASGSTSFTLVSLLRKLTKVQKIGHAGTLDPFATGVMVMLIGKNYTRRQKEFLQADKEYVVKIKLGEATTTFDREGEITKTSPLIPTLEEIEKKLKVFQGTYLQTPPMFSAKKVAGKKLCDLARKGITIDRAAIPVEITTELISYSYPFLELKISCSKGTYVRSIVHDLGERLGTNAHAFELKRTRSGSFHLSDCVNAEKLKESDFNINLHLREVPCKSPIA